MVTLQGRQTQGAVSKAWAKRGSRTVKYWAPWSKVPNGLRRVDIRPPTPLLFSNKVTRCPACTSVRAQLIAASPAPTMAMFLGSCMRGSPGRFYGSPLSAFGLLYTRRKGCAMGQRVFT